MQALANDVLDKNNNTVQPNVDSIVNFNNEYESLFSENEIIFPDKDSTRIFSRYGYKITNMNFLVPENIISKVIKDPNIYKLPNSPSWIEGLINVRGNIIPVMNINNLVKKTSSEKYNHVLVISESGNKPAIAIMISDIPVSLEHNDNKASASNYPAELHGFIQDGFIQGNLDWVEFNPQDLFEKLAKK